MNSITGQDTLTIDGVPINDWFDANCGEYTYSGEIAKMKKGKNGNTIVAMDETGNVMDIKIRLLASSTDDARFQEKLTGFVQNPTGFVGMSGTLVKRYGDGTGNAKKITYVLSFGIFSKNIDATTNSEGDANQGVAIYVLKFGTANRVIG